MTLGDLGAVGSFLASIAVFVTLVYLARQVHQGNVFARMQSRESMMNQDLLTIKLQLADPDITKSFYKESLSEEDLLKLALFLILFLRQREWEWLLYKDGVFPEDVYRTYVEVIPLVFGTKHALRWWNSIGKTAIDPGFAAEIDRLLENRPHTDYWIRLADFVSGK